MHSISYCYRSGEILIGPTCPKTAIPLASGPADLLETTIEGLARLAYDNKTWLVPGIPEAPDEAAALRAAQTFARNLAARIKTKLMTRE